MTAGARLDLQHLTAANASANFNRRAGFEVVAAENGYVEIRMPWSDDLFGR